jgi:hypothetical protein
MTGSYRNSMTENGGNRVLQARSLTQQDIFVRLEERLGRVHARQRLGIERDHEAQIFGQGINFFHPGVMG